MRISLEEKCNLLLVSLSVVSYLVHRMLFDNEIIHCFITVQWENTHIPVSLGILGSCSGNRRAVLNESVKLVADDEWPCIMALQ